MKNFIIIVTVVYIIGIIMGLYIENICIALLLCIFCVLMNLLYVWYKNRHAVNKKVKLLDKKSICINILIFGIMIISLVYTIYCQSRFNTLYSKLEKVNVYGTVINLESESDYYRTYRVKIKSVNNLDKYKNTLILARFSKNINTVQIGNIVKFNGSIIEPDVQRNYMGFSFKNYLNSNNVYTTVKVVNIEKVKENNFSIYGLKNYIITCTNKVLKGRDNGLCLALTLGYKAGLTENIKSCFEESGLLHLLSISGMHVSYMFIVLDKLFNRTSKRKSKVIIICIMFFYIKLTGYNVCIMRACIMQILCLISDLLYRKSNTVASLSISALITLIINPVVILNTGFIFSYMATISIINYFPDIMKLLDILQVQTLGVFVGGVPKSNNIIGFIFSKIFRFIINIVAITVSVNILILPLSIIFYHSVTPMAIFSNIFLSPLVPIVMITSCLQIGVAMINSQISGFLSILSIFFYNLFSNLVEVFSKIKLSKIYVATPNMVIFIAYYLGIIGAKSFFYKNELGEWKKRISIFLKKTTVTYIIVAIVAVAIGTRVIPNSLKIFFIDVGQGESSLIITPQNKSILIDGGGSESFDVGKKTLLPYLLARGIHRIDYVVISHFDTDHVGGILTVIQEMEIKNIIISKQENECDNYTRFKKIVKKKNIKVVTAGRGDCIGIEKNINLNIIWPNKSKIIKENSLNNNSIVCKLNYKDFSILFTGDIEETAEKQIIQEYVNNPNILNSTVLKVGHHGSKTSSSQDFLNLVKPKLALIGVGKNNKFGHPNEEVLCRLEKIRNKNL